MTGKRGRPQSRGGNVGGAGTVIARVSAAIRELEGVIAAQAREIMRLRTESRLADRIRKAFRD
jgi:hypothetical protein